VKVVIQFADKFDFLKPYHEVWQSALVRDLMTICKAVDCYFCSPLFICQI